MEIDGRRLGPADREQYPSLQLAFRGNPVTTMKKRTASPPSLQRVEPRANARALGRRCVDERVREKDQANYRRGDQNN